MSTAAYIDIHSHYPSPSPEVWTLQSLYHGFEQAEAMPVCSIGLHPWYLGALPQQMAMLERYATGDTVWAIGECGLDKVCQMPWVLQEEAFRMQINLANKLHKPLIIHCVRAYTETLRLLRDAQVPVIFHGFQKNAALARSIWEQGYYLSFGKALPDGKPQAIASLEAMPADRFFLETDDAPLSIKEVYRAVAEIRKTGEDALILQLQKNFKTVFAL